MQNKIGIDVDPAVVKSIDVSESPLNGAATHQNVPADPNMMSMAVGVMPRAMPVAQPVMQMATAGGGGLGKSSPGQTIDHIETITTAEIPDAVYAAATSKFALMLYGPPGCGKTEVVLALTKDEKLLNLAKAISGLDLDSLPVVCLTAPELNVENVTGLPCFAEVKSVDKDGNPETRKVTNWASPGVLDPVKPYILFVDEINRCEPSVRHAMYQLITGKETSSGYKLPEGSVVVMAGNRITDGAGCKSNDTAFNGRCMHLNVKTDVKAWLGWAEDHGVSPQMRAFITRTPGMLEKFSAADPSPSQSMPRTLAAADGMIRDPLVNKALVSTFVKATIGREVGQLFYSFMKHEDAIPDPEMIKNNPESVKIPAANEVDKAWIFAFAVADQLKLKCETKNVQTDKLANGLGVVLSKLIDAGHMEAAVYALVAAHKRSKEEQQGSKSSGALNILGAMGVLTKNQRFKEITAALVNEMK